MGAFQKQPPEVFYKINCSEKFPNNAKFLGTTILKKICERLLLAFCNNNFSRIDEVKVLRT